MKNSLRSLIANSGKVYRKTIKVARAVSDKEQESFLIEKRQLFNNNFQKKVLINKKRYIKKLNTGKIGKLLKRTLKKIKTGLDLSRLGINLRLVS